MEEQVKQEEIKVEVVEEKKKFFTKKKILAIGGTLLAVLTLGVVVSVSGKNSEETKQIPDSIDTIYEPVDDSEKVE